MKLTLDRVLAIAGVIFTVLAPFDFFHRRTVEGLLFSLLVLLIIILLLYRRWEDGRTLFTYLKIDKKLSFVDKDAALALMEGVFTVRANHTGLQQLWFRNINCDGEIKNIRVDGVPSVPQKKAGSLEVCKQFNRPLMRGDETTVQLSYELHGSFKGATEGMTHVIGSTTKALSIRVTFHEEKLAKEFRAFVGRGSGVEEPLKDQPRSTENGHEAEMVVSKPKIGSYYTVEWKW